MTNEEAYSIISEFCFTGYGDNKKPTGELFNAIHELVCEVKENDKLKAEVEQFSNELISVRIENELLRKKNELTNYYFEQYVTAIDEIEQLKSELEQSAIQCTHGYDKRQNEIGETLIFCEHTDNWMNVTLGECIGNCEAEQHLKGKV